MTFPPLADFPLRPLRGHLSRWGEDFRKASHQSGASRYPIPRTVCR